MRLAGNLVALLGSALMVSIGFIREKQRILLAQCGQFFLMGLGNLLLGAVSGAVSNFVSILRNLVFARREATVTLKIGFIILQLALTFMQGVPAPIEALPILSTVIFTWAMDLKDDLKFKFVLIGTLLLWLAYDLYYHNYAAFTFDVLTVLTTSYSIVRLLRGRNN